MRYIKGIGLLFMLVLSSVLAYGQNSILDSLREMLRHDRHNDTTLHQYYFQRAVYLNAQGRDDSAFRYLQQAFEIARRLDYDEGMADHYHFLSVFHSRRQHYDTAMVNVRHENRWAQKSGNPSKLAFAYNDLGNMHIYYGNGDSAVISFLKALPLSEKIGNDRLSSNIANNLSAAYNMIEDYASARDYAKRGFTIAERLNDSSYMVNSLLNWATMEAKLENNDTALVLFDRSEVLAEKTGDSAKKMDILNNVGEILYKQHKYRESLSKYDDMLALAASYNDPVYDLYAYMNRGNTLAALHRYTEAAADLSHGIRLAKPLKANFELTQLYLFSSDLAEKRQDYRQALSYWKAADSLKEISSKEKTRNDIHRLEVQYQTAQKDQSIAQQKLQLAERQAVIRRKNTINIGLLVGCTLLGIIIALGIRNAKHRRRLFAQERELYERNISELEKKHQLEAMQSVLKGQEQERSRLARDLHDGVGGLLSGVKLTLSTMSGNMFLPEESVRSFGKVIEQLDQSIGELRRVSHNMMPEVLIKYGLKEALENYCENIDLSGRLSVRLQTYGLEERIGQDTEIILYRIIQELLTNVIKHADAKHVLVQLVRERDTFSLTVEDDGHGFDLTDGAHSTGVGLQNIRARAGYLNGTVDIQSAAGEGTSITVAGTIH